MVSFELFKSEDILIEEAKQLAKSDKLGDAAQPYKELVAAYRKLLKTTKRLVRFSDQNEEKLNELAKELAKSNELLEMQKQEILEGARLKDDVERIMRHDLKSPLTTVISLPQLLMMADNIEEYQKEMLARIEEAGYTLLSMVNLSTSLFKMERGSYTFVPESMDLAAVVRKVFSNIEDSAQMHGVDLRLKIDGNDAAKDETFLIMAEELLCYSMLANLIGNAMDATPDNEPIIVSLKRDGEYASTTAIINKGHVPEEIKDRFFEKYATAGKSRGTGLGAYSAKLIAKAHGGDVTIDCTDDTVFVAVALPGAPVEE